MTARTHLQKTHRRIIQASLLLCALLLTVGVVHWNDVREADSVTERADTVHSIRLQRPGFPDIDLLRQSDEHWRIVEPCVLPVNGQRLAPLLDALSPTAHSYAAAEVDLETAGLSKPQAVVQLNQETLLIGQTDLSGERRYLQRGDRVQFVPEWVLSLVNGGLSALASLNVFSQVPDQLLVAGAERAALGPDQLDQWRSLTAQQIATWPLQDAGEETAARSFIVDFGDRSVNMTLHHYAGYAAIHYENARCAYILPLSSLPDSAFP